MLHRVGQSAQASTHWSITSILASAKFLSQGVNLKLRPRVVKTIILATVMPPEAAFFYPLGEVFELTHRALETRHRHGFVHSLHFNLQSNAAKVRKLLSPLNATLYVAFFINAQGRLRIQRECVLTVFTQCS